MKRSRHYVGRLWLTVRKAYGLSLREVARRMDISAPYLSHLERGMRNVTPAVEAKFYKAVRK